MEHILLGLSALSGEKIEPGRTLIFLDEVQDIPEVVASLNRECTLKLREYVIPYQHKGRWHLRHSTKQTDIKQKQLERILSLLGGLNMADSPFPTGKVDILHLYPMTYAEFLDALGERAKLVEKYERTSRLYFFTTQC
mgnify:CR=1 FL=1